VHTANEKNNTQMRTVVMDKNFTEISAVELLLAHFAHFTALKQCRERLHIFIIFIVTGNPFIDCKLDQ